MHLYAQAETDTWQQPSQYECVRIKLQISHSKSHLGPEVSGGAHSCHGQCCVCVSVAIESLTIWLSLALPQVDRVHAFVMLLGIQLGYRRACIASFTGVVSQEVLEQVENSS